MAYIIHICNHGRQNMYLDLYEGTKTLFSYVQMYSRYGYLRHHPCYTGIF